MTDNVLYEYLGEVFEWNRMKAARNAIKHRVRFTEAATVFFDEDAIFSSDDEHSEGEQRYTVVGHSLQSRVLFIVHVLRKDRTRIISARQLAPREREQYENELGRRLRNTGRD